MATAFICFRSTLICMHLLLLLFFLFNARTHSYFQYNPIPSYLDQCISNLTNHFNCYLIFLVDGPVQTIGGRLMKLGVGF